MMLEPRGELLGCPHCTDTRFTRLAPPYSAATEVRCAGCGKVVKLVDLQPHAPRAPLPPRFFAGLVRR